jgi:hypothetical protein
MHLSFHSPVCRFVLSREDEAVAGDFAAMADGCMEARGHAGRGRDKGKGK